MERNSGVSCRICKSFAENDLIKSPCLCKGSLGYVHFSCLEQWLNQASRNYCELCRCQFQAIQSRRYGFIRSLFVWINNPTHRNYLCYDLVITMVLTGLTVAIVFICLVGAGVLTHDGETGLEDPFVRVIILVFLFIIMASYVATLYLIVQDHVKPWYRWWQNCVDVKLIIDPSKLQPPRNINNNTDKIPAAPNIFPAAEVESREILTVSHSEDTLSQSKLHSAYNKDFPEVKKHGSNILLCTENKISERNSIDE